MTMRTIPLGGDPSQWGPIDVEQHKKSAAAAPEVLEIGPVPEGLVWVLSHVACEDETTAFTKVRVGIADSLSFRPLEEQDPGIADELYTIPEPIIVPEGKYLRAQFTGTTSGDMLALYINGHWLRRG